MKIKLSHLFPTAVLSVAVDASNTHISAVLQQTGSTCQSQPLSFFSKRPFSAQTKYSTFDRKLLAAFFAVRNWGHLLEGHHFELFTDYMLLTAAINRATQP